MSFSELNLFLPNADQMQNIAAHLLLKLNDEVYDVIMLVNQ